MSKHEESINRLEEFRQITTELEALKNRVRRIIGSRHFPSDGEWKESIIRTFLRRNLPDSFKIGRGFVVSTQDCTKQIDVLIYEADKPILFQEGDFVCITPDAVRVVLEVKTSLRIRSEENPFQNLGNNMRLIRSNAGGFRAISGIISIDSCRLSNQRISEELMLAAKSRTKGVINLVSIGQNKFYRYFDFWPNENGEGMREYKKWHRYQINKCAPAYFLVNIIEELCSYSVQMYPELWYPKGGKEKYLKEIIDLDQ